MSYTYMFSLSLYSVFIIYMVAYHCTTVASLSVVQWRSNDGRVTVQFGGRQLYLSVAVTGDKCCIFFRFRRR